MLDGVTAELAFCEAVTDYLLGFASLGVTPDVLNGYLSCPARKTHIGGIYEQLLWSAQNANMRAGVISGSVDGGIGALREVLFGFDPQKVVNRYGDDWEAVLDDIERCVRPRGQLRRKPGSIWPQYCRSILSGARFLLQFSDAAAFYKWGDGFAANGLTRASLPTLISGQVSGLGFALSCDFLKELGFATYGKPDVHIRAIFVGLGLMPRSASNESALELLLQFADKAGLSAYHVDKLLWLLGSGYFYRHDAIGHVPSRRDTFVAEHRYVFGESS